MINLQIEYIKTCNYIQEDINEERLVAKDDSSDDEVEEVPLSVVEFLEEIEVPIKNKVLPAEMGKFVYTSMLGTAQHLRLFFHWLFKDIKDIVGYFFLPIINYKVS